MNKQFAKLIKNHESQIQSLCSEYGVLRLLVFGSATTAEWDSARSDIDFAAEFGEPTPPLDLFTQFFGFHAELEHLFERKVDLVERSAIRKEQFRAEVDRFAVEIYAA